MKQVESIGLVKFDFLGLKTLTVLDQTVELIEKNRSIQLKLSEIPLDDSEIYAVLGAGSNLGFSRQEYWNGLPFSSPGDLPNPGIEPGSPALQTDALLSEPLGKPKCCLFIFNLFILIRG